MISTMTLLHEKLPMFMFIQYICYLTRSVAQNRNITKYIIDSYRGDKI